jgi:hypothetical protein
MEIFSSKASAMRVLLAEGRFGNGLEDAGLCRMSDIHG